MNVLVFGASGEIGTWVMHYALKNGHRVTAYVRHLPKMQQDNENLTVVQGEITDQEKVADTLVGQDAVIWCVGIPMKWKYLGMQSLEGHKILIQAMQERGVKRLIDWGTPSIHSARDKKSFVTVAPGILGGAAVPAGKTGDGCDCETNRDIWSRLDDCPFYGSERYSVYR